ncbi:MAG: PTS IIA-like nitrogen-regulatory protein PtsN [Gammaproteobacteria bacterium]|jgi:PTS system nitrogen regulatory IIA component|nr:PTS IIA-like nitrogen-regulatory protein PtsN [Gammaproteobacteria bacterium]HJN94238.1 PTS IIA-like nitrogen regulatory protein PtsN [Gammaproteobacteria bacterium]|tara:strand:- start:26488 stop:26937 length:450 start_codon:yes stop_codon:yes gene_type:complete
MQLDDMLTPERCHSGLAGVSKKRLLTAISELVSAQHSELDADEIFNALMAREQLGSTGLGNGIAIPHCRVSSCREIVGSLITLDNPIDFDSIDGKPVDILFVLIVSEQKTDEHVKALARLAELFNDEDFCYTLRHTHDGDDLYNVAVTY